MRLFVVAGWIAGGLLAGFGSLRAQGGAGDVVPEQAFARAEALPPADSVVALPAYPATDAPSILAPVPLEFAPRTNFSEILDAQNHPPPFYRRWVESLLSLLASDEPYRRDKLVVVLGSTVGYDNNVLYSGVDPVASPTYGVRGRVDYHFGSRRLQLDASLSGGVTYYQNRPGGSNDENFALTLASDYKLMPRVRFTVNTYTAYLSQPSPQVIGGVFQFTGSYFYTNTSLGLNYQVRPRFGISTSFAYNALTYDDKFINNNSGFTQQNYSISGNWLVSPRTTLILQYRYNPVQYYLSGLGSTGNFLLFGVEQSLSPRLNYTFLAGVEARSLQNPAPGAPSSYLGPFAEGSLTYRFAPRSNLVGTLRLGTEPSGSQGVIRETFRASVGVEHSLGSRLTLTSNLGFERDNYDQPGVQADYTQDIFTGTLALRYQIAQFTYAVVRDDYIFLSSTVPNGTYNRNAISIGLEVQF